MSKLEDGEDFESSLIDSEHDLELKAELNSTIATIAPIRKAMSDPKEVVCPNAEEVDMEEP